jgi:hypothetical protein
MVAASVTAVPQADTPSASEDLICHITSHDSAEKPVAVTNRYMVVHDMRLFDELFSIWQVRVAAFAPLVKLKLQHNWI